MCLNSEIFKDCELDFEEFLSKLNLDFETYIYALRSSLKQDKVFSKRKPKEVRINAYNVTLLRSEDIPEDWLDDQIDLEN